MLALALVSVWGCLARAAPSREEGRAAFVPRFQHFGVEEGLAQSSAVCLAQDAQGFIWVGTYAGLSRFDGYGFRNYSASGAPGSLADNNIRALLPASDGTLWVGTRGGGLSRLNGASQTFTNYLHNPQNAASVPSNEVNAMLETQDGTLLLGTAKGLAEWSPSFARCVSRPALADPAWGEVVALAKTDGGTIWASSRRRLARYDQTGRFLSPFTLPGLDAKLQSGTVTTLFPEGDDVLWIGTETAGLLRLDLRQGVFSSFLPGTNVYRLLRDHDGALWVSTDAGLARQLPDQADAGFELFTNNPFDPDTLSQNDALSLLEDTSGILWVGTYSGGLNKLVPGSRYFVTYKHAPGEPGSLPGREVSSMTLDREGQLWVGMRYEGLVCLGPSEQDGRRKVLRTYRNQPDDPSSLSENAINCLLEDSRGRIWVGTVDSGISVLDKTSGSFRQFRHNPADPGSISQDKIWCLFEDRDGYIWVGTSKGGLNRLDPATGRCQRYRNDPANPASLSNDRVTPILETPDGTLWIGTDAGLDSFDRDTGLFRTYGLKDGLADEGIQGLARDETGALWLSTFKGISRFDPSSGAVRNFGRRDGLVGVEFTMNAYHQGWNGELFFGGFSGMNAFFPGMVEPNLHAPSVALCWLKVNNREHVVENYPTFSSVRLNPGDTTLALEFTGTDYANPQRNQYAYRLEGFDTDWVHAGTTRTATYTNLDPGSFNLLVRASNNEGLWGEPSTLLRVTVVPPLWKTAWFKGLLACLLAGLAYGTYSWRLRSLKARRLELERTVELQTASLRREIEVRGKAEAELRESQQSFQAIFQYSPVAVIISSLHDGRLLQVNKAFCTMIGRPVEDILGRTGIELGTWASDAHRNEVVSRLLAKRLILNEEYSPDWYGGGRHVLYSAAVVDVFNEPCAIWLITDITERKQLEQDIIAARERAESASQAKSDFLANISHEIRSPLNAILGLTELALNRPLEDDVRGLLVKVTSAGHVLLGVINDVLDISKIEAGHLELCPAQFSLHAVFQRLSDIYGMKASAKGVRFKVDLAPDMPDAVIGDGLRLEQVLINLVGNAVKFTDSGEVAVSARCLREEGGSLMLSCSVRDSGIGMTPEQMERVFTPFVQAEGFTTRRYGGTGLGLSIVKRLVGMMGGDVTLDSFVGRGSTFSFTARFAPGDPEPAPALRQGEGLEALRGLRVLVVDDNELNRELTTELARMAGMSPMSAASAQEALELLEANTFDIALLDVQMPVMDGYQLARAIRGRLAPGQRLVLLALTAHAMAGDKEKCLAAGMDDYLTKPVMPDVLFAAIKRLVRPKA